MARLAKLGTAGANVMLLGRGGERLAAKLGATPMQVALAWLLQRSPNVLLIPGTSSRGHLRENLAAAELNLPNDAIRILDAIVA